MLGDEISFFLNIEDSYNPILEETKTKAGDVRHLNILNISPHEIQKLLLSEAGWVERLQNLLLVLLIHQLDAVVDQVESLRRASVFCTRHIDHRRGAILEKKNISRHLILQKKNLSRVVVDELEEMISSGGQI